MILLIIPGVSVAATNGTIKGIVSDEGGLPIPGVVITVSSDNLMGARQGQTSMEGGFYLSELPPGVYRLEAKRSGFSTVVRP